MKKDKPLITEDILRVNSKYILGRIKDLLGCKTNIELANLMGVSNQAVGGEKWRVPMAWISKIHKETGASFDWLLTGEGPVKVGDQEESSNPLLHLVCKWLKEVATQDHEEFARIIGSLYEAGFGSYLGKKKSSPEKQLSQARHKKSG